jgi:hypothetical protein
MATITTRQYMRPRKGRSGFDLLHAGDTPEDEKRLALEGYKPTDTETARAAVTYNSKGWAQGEDAYRLGLKERPVEVTIGRPNAIQRIEYPPEQDWSDAKHSSGRGSVDVSAGTPAIISRTPKAPGGTSRPASPDQEAPPALNPLPISDDELEAMFTGANDPGQGKAKMGEAERDRELEAAQGRARDASRIATIGRAGAQFNEALTGARYDRTAYDDFARNANLPVVQLGQRREALAQRQGRARQAEQDRLRAEEHARSYARQQQQDAYQRERDALGDRRHEAESRESARRFDLSRRDAAANRALQRQSQADARAMAQQQRVDAARLKAEAHDAENAQKRAEKLGQATSKAPFGELQSALSSLDELAPGLIYGQEPEDNPLSTKDRLANALPFGFGDRFIGDKGLKYKSALQNLRDLITRARSGAAISDSEERHYLSLLGDDILSDPRRAAAGINEVRQSIGQKLRDAQVAYAGPTLDNYEAEGGTTYRNRVFGQPPPKRQGPVRVQSPDGRTGTLDPSEVEEAVRNGWKVL